jgi:hypothetical protein
MPPTATRRPPTRRPNTPTLFVPSTTPTQVATETPTSGGGNPPPTNPPPTSAPPTNTPAPPS